MEIEKLDPHSMNIVEAQKSKLKEVFPEVFTEGGEIDFERLKLTLGECVDTGKERYGMNWPGKAECYKTIQYPSLATLVPCPEESVDFDNTENLFIEGDNLEVLKLLQRSYLGKIKMIYIDPPYNTGNDFIYPDNYTESLETYLSYTGQIDAEGRKFSTNTETEGRFHSKWLNMMYPRLFLAKNLLRDDGVIFISIDDNEVSNLRKICDEIFGEENFVACIIWQKKQSPQNDATYLSDMHDYIVVYAKMAKQSKQDYYGWDRNLIARTQEQEERFENPDNDPRGRWISVDYTCNKSASERPNLYYAIINPNNKEEVWPSRERVWRFDQETHKRNERENKLWWGKNGNNFPRLKRFRSELKDGIVPSTWWHRDFAGDNQESKRELGVLFNDSATPFDTPKPTRLIKKILEIASNPEDNNIILDFFAGSCTTAHAILDLNKVDNGNRKFICVQLPEPTDPNSEAYKAGYKSITAIGKERIRRVIKKINDENKSKLNFAENAGDLGFKVFKLAPSNIKVWRGKAADKQEAVERLLIDHIEHISRVSREEAVLYEIILKCGFELSAKIEKINLAGNVVYSIADGALLVCLEENLSNELFRAIAEKKPSRCIILDRGFKDKDHLKTSAVQTMKDRGVEFRTV